MPPNLSTKYPVPNANSFVFIKYKNTFAFQRAVGSLGFFPFWACQVSFLGLKSYQLKWKVVWCETITYGFGGWVLFLIFLFDGFLWDHYGGSAYMGVLMRRPKKMYFFVGWPFCKGPSIRAGVFLKKQEYTKWFSKTYGYFQLLIVTLQNLGN